MAQPILTVENIRVRYSGLPVLQGVSIQLDAGETVCVVGANGAGKSTLLRAVMGTQKVFEGRICFKGREIQRLRTEEIVRLGIVYVPEEKMLFKPLSVAENIRLGAFVLKDRTKIEKNLEFVYDLFPRLRIHHGDLVTIP
ncbi:MAG: ATP-binding cassette domain-containing protein, partial [Desulfobacterales bacterium]|nr:ATP-binding cassette domain-containing protein [Desulfobacterales bacterium]